MAGARDAALVVGQGAREAAVVAGVAVSNALSTAAEGLRACGRALKAASMISGRYVKETARASYNIAGEYTFPIEQEFVGTYPPELSDLHPIGVGVLALPVILPTMVCSVTVIPFLGNSLQTFTKTVVSATNLTLDKDDEIVANNLANDARCWARAYVYGLPGFAAGSVVGIGAAAIVLAGRIVTNSFWSFNRGFAWFADWTLHADDEFKLGQDDRSTFRRVLGIPGLLTGGAFGFVAMVLIGLGRTLNYIITNSAISFDQSFTWFANSTLPTKIPLEEDRRSPLEKSAGLLGLVLGGAFGIVAAIAIGIGRLAINFATNSAVSFGRAFAWFANLTLPTKIPLEEDGRSPIEKRAGLLGLVLGGAFGFVAMVAVGIGRALINISTNNAISFRRSFIWVTNFTLPSEYRTKLEDDDRSLIKKGAGFISLMLGGVFGFVAAIGIGIGRILINVLTNSATSFCRSFMWFANLTWPTKIPLEVDGRSLLEKSAGLFGLVLGGAFGFVAAIAIGMGRLAINFVTNSAVSFGFAFTWFANLTLPTKIALGEDNRSPIEKGTGLFGLVLGGVFGFIAMAAIGIGRILINVLTNNAISFDQAFVRVMNLALHVHEAEKLVEVQRSWVDKGIGIPGLLVGGALGFINAIFISVMRSFLALSGSLINGAVKRYWFEGLGGDDRSWKQKTVGGLGYVLAAVTTGPLAVVIFCMRQVPTLLALALGVFASPIVAVCKFSALLACPSKPRFGEEQIENAKDVEDAFMKIYSSLTAFGRLRSGEVEDKGNGEESWSSFTRKCFTFNARTVTERTLDALLEAFRSSDEKGVAFFESDAFDSAIETVKDYYRNDCLATNRETTAILEEIDRVANFVKTYINDRTVKIEPGLYQNASWAATFWGGSRAASAVVRPRAPENTEVSVSDDMQPGM